MNKTLFFMAAIFFTLTLSGCGGTKEEAQTAQVAPPSTTSTPSAKSLDLASAGSVKGRVLFAGEIPAPKATSVKGNPECAVLHAGGAVNSEEMLGSNGGLQNVFVYVKEGLEGTVFETPKTPVTIMNKKCVYVPHVVGAQIDQEVRFLNEDATLHNIHAYPKTNKAFNLGLPLVGMKQTKKFVSEEVMIPLKCDVHPWMLGYIGVLSHPYFQVTDSEGNFEIKDLPVGEYLLEAWHEKLGTQSLKIKIEPKMAISAELKYS